MDHQKPEDPTQTLFQRIHQNMDRLNFLSTHLPRPAYLTWPGNTDPKKPLPYLPQEIQDQICRYAVSTTYEMGESRSTRPARTTQAILTSSKRNYDEGLKSLYANGVFRYTIAANDATTHFKPALTDHMMHIKVVVNCQITDGLESNLRLNQLVNTFAGTYIKRKTFRYCLRSFECFMSLENLWLCLRPLWGLQGFDTVRVEFDVFGKRPGVAEALVERYLDQILGPATVGDGRAKHFFVFGFFVFGTRYVEFHPNGYHASKNASSDGNLD